MNSLFICVLFITALTSLGHETRQPLAPTRPKSNSILHLFGEWLFEAAFIGCDLPQSNLFALFLWIFVEYNFLRTSK